MAAKKKNHTVTRGYLTGWKAAGPEGRNGLWYFDLEKGEVAFSSSLNAPFAISKYLYSPKNIDGIRDDRFENWISESESDLCSFVRNYSSAKPVRSNPKVVLNAINSAICMGYRSEYTVKTLEAELLKQNPDIDIGILKLTVLNDLYETAHERMRFFRDGTILVLRGISSPLLTNDQPFWDMTPQDEAHPIGMFTLSPNCLMLLSPNHKQPDCGFKVVFRPARECSELVDFARLAAMRMARKWVVCSSEREARDVAAYLTEERIAEAASTDRLRPMPYTEARTLFPI